MELVCGKLKDFFFPYCSKGDQNVPAGQITFRADLPFCMHLSQREQESFENIESVQPASSEVEWYELPTPQPFVVPYDCVERHHQVPDSCKARYLTHS